MNRLVYIIGCSNAKSTAETPIPAQRRYLSERFKLATQLASRLGTQWYILSARFGLLAPETPIPWYDTSIDALTRDDYSAWSNAVAQGLHDRIQPRDIVVFLADNAYAPPFLDQLARMGIVGCLPFEHIGNSSYRLEWLKTALGMTPRAKHLARLYSALDRLRAGRDFHPTLATLANGSHVPGRGVYFFFEDSEPRITDPTLLRIVRVGTHAVSTGSRSTLWTRLRTHRGTGSGDGNHRSSIMRLHIGRALIHQTPGKYDASTWGVGQAASLQIRAREALLEKDVSHFIGRMRVACLSVPDEPSALSDRAYLERNCIALLAGPTGCVDPCTTSWLGRSSPHPIINRSSLWNVDWADADYDPRFLDVLDHYVDLTLGILSPDGRSLAPTGWNARTKHPTSALPQTTLWGTPHDRTSD